MLKILDQSFVHISDRSKVNNILHNIKNGGHSSVQVIADFDRTLSKMKDSNGTLLSSCHNALETSSILPSNYREKSRELFEYYYNIEISADMSIEEKIPHMIEWWNKSHGLLIPLKITKLQLREMVQGSNITLRDGVIELFKLLNKENIPLLIFSAGLGDVIELVIEKHSKLYDNMHIVSNYMQFSEQGFMTSFKEPLIHTFNKNEGAVKGSSYFDLELSNRRNVILIGDSLGDLTMADGAQPIDNLLKIAFLNDKEDALIEMYKKKYDIVLTGDGDFSLILTILKSI